MRLSIWIAPSVLLAPLFVLTTAPVATTDTFPPPLCLNRMPMNLPETDPTVMLSEAPVEVLASPSKILMPSPPPLIAPDAVSSVFPAPSFSSSMACPPALPVTVATLTTISPPPELVFLAEMAEPVFPVFLNSVFARISILPVPAFVAWTTPVSPTTAAVWVSELWYHTMSPLPEFVLFKMNAVPEPTVMAALPDT